MATWQIEHMNSSLPEHLHLVREPHGVVLYVNRKDARPHQWFAPDWLRVVVTTVRVRTTDGYVEHKGTW